MHIEKTGLVMSSGMRHDCMLPPSLPTVHSHGVRLQCRVFRLPPYLALPWRQPAHISRASQAWSSEENSRSVSSCGTTVKGRRQMWTWKPPLSLSRQFSWVLVVSLRSTLLLLQQMVALSSGTPARVPGRAKKRMFFGGLAVGFVLSVTLMVAWSTWTHPLVVQLHLGGGLRATRLATGEVVFAGFEPCHNPSRAIDEFAVGVEVDIPSEHHLRSYLLPHI